MRSDAEEESIAEEEIASAQGGAAAGGGHGLATRIDELRSELHHILGPEVLDNAYRRLRAMAEGEDDVVDQEVRLILGCPPPPPSPSVPPGRLFLTAVCRLRSEQNATCIYTIQKLIMCEDLVQGV